MTEQKPRLTGAERAARRQLAVQNVLDGRTQTDVADFLGVHPVTVAKWMAAYRAGGEAALAAKPKPGRRRFLTPEQETEVCSWLRRSPTEFGYHTELWTAARVAHVIQTTFGVRFHPNYLREWLTKQGCSPQKPIRRAKQRNPVVIDAWLGQGYPAIQKK